MNTPYRAIAWNQQKALYTATVLLAAVLGLAAFAAVTRTLNPHYDTGLIILRGTAFLAFFLLSFLLCIGPLATLSPRFIPLLYNRRHLGVGLFLIAAAHAITAMYRLLAGAGAQALLALLNSYARQFARAFTSLEDLRHIPFEPFGALALAILFLLAATSHDFWQRLLGAPLWRGLHCLIYPAYALIVLHVAFGFLQAEYHIIYPVLFIGITSAVLALRLVAAFQRRERRAAAMGPREDDGFVPVCTVSELTEAKGRSARAGDTDIALFRHAGRAYAVSGACPHQGAPLGEARILDGMITCPWHGRQFHHTTGACAGRPQCGLAVFPVEVRGDVVYVNPEPLPPGTDSDGAILSASAARVDPEALRGANARFYVGARGFQSEPEQVFTQYAATTLLLLTPLLMAAAALGQSALDTGVYEAGNPYTYTGVFSLAPVPNIYVAHGATNAGSSRGYHMPLSWKGRTAPPEAWRGLDGNTITFEAAPVYRGNTILLLPGEDSTPEIGAPPNPNDLPPDPVIQGPLEIEGELVDITCYLGKSWPATGNLHRACAIRALAGGAIPGILIRSTEGEALALLATSDGSSLDYELFWAGRSVRARGSLQRLSGFDVFLTADIALNTATGPGAARMESGGEN